MSPEDRDWEAELNDAAEAEATAEAEAEQSFMTQPDPGTPAGDPAPDVQPESVAAPETPARDGNDPVSGNEPEDTFDGGEFNPDLLPPELQPGWRQLQGAFTRKTQELAEERRQLDTQMAQLGDSEVVSAAFDLYSAIQNPENWPQLYQELADAMAEQGLAPGDPSPVEPEAPAPALPAGLEGLSDDPELAPLASTIKELSSRIAQFEAREQEQAMMRQAEHEYQQRVAAFEAQERKIKELYPNYETEDWDEIFALTPFYGGNLVAAQQHYESRMRRDRERYLSSKQSARGVAESSPPAGQPAASAPVEEQPKTIRDVEDEAVEYIRALQAAGDLDF